METRTQLPEIMQVVLFAALIILLAFTPFLQYIPLGYTRAAIIHIPVIIGSLMLGPKKGALLGLVFALTGFGTTVVDPGTNSLILTPPGASGEIPEKIGALAACFLPRILVGVIPCYVYSGVSHITEKQIPALAMAGLLGSLVHTSPVSVLVYNVFRNITSSVSELNPDRAHTLLLSILKSHEILEAVIAAVLVSLICRIIFRLR